MLISFFNNIQLPFPNTYRDIWEYQNAFFEKRIDFHRFIGAQCPLCGKEGCYRQIKEYYRFAIELFPFKKAKVPIARLLCKTTQRTFSLLPHQLIPYCQYTLAAMTQTLLRVHEFQQAGYNATSGLKWTHFPPVFEPAFLIKFIPRRTRLIRPFQRVMWLPAATAVGPLFGPRWVHF